MLQNLAVSIPVSNESLCDIYFMRTPGIYVEAGPGVSKLHRWDIEKSKVTRNLHSKNS